MLNNSDEFRFLALFQVLLQSVHINLPYLMDLSYHRWLDIAAYFARNSLPIVPCDVRREHATSLCTQCIYEIRCAGKIPWIGLERSGENAVKKNSSWHYN